MLSSLSVLLVAVEISQLLPFVSSLRVVSLELKGERSEAGDRHNRGPCNDFGIDVDDDDKVFTSSFERFGLSPSGPFLETLMFYALQIQ